MSYMDKNSHNTANGYTNPIDMLVEITNRCNHCCIFCAHRKMEHKQGEIEASLLRRILCEAYEMGVRRVGLYTTGEMFMCRDVATHIRNAKEIGYEYVYADTNGALATEEKLLKVISAGLDSIKFSINAACKETYAFIHGHDDFDKVIENLIICHRLREKINPKLKIMVSFVVTQRTEAEVEVLRKIVSPYSDVFLTHPVRPYLQQYDADLSYLKTDMYGNNAVTIPCSMVMNRIHITYDGFLSACCVDFNHDLLLADLKTTPLKEAWICENAINLRKRHMRNQLDGIMCDNCLNGKFSPYEPLKIS